MISIGIPVTSFHHFMEAADGTRSVDFAQIMGWRSFRSFQETTLPAATVILNRLMEYARNGKATNIEIECSVLELLSMSFRSFLADGLPGRSKLSRTDMLKIREARDILLERMAEPPSLLGLSRLIGLNDYKLKTGFKEMYGATVYGYLREQRLEKAYRLLTEGNMNVIDVSCAVGYSNSSYFAEAFRTKYGINPGSLVRRSSASLSHDH
ncbi:AraC family transcriptional regulator [Paenibacillus dendritiformis]|uniref:helix-turn-helix transcriptional regulator n=1 Tax=Paenibacillus dendritiformis TaxID=130049 RepID=UPI0030B870F6